MEAIECQHHNNCGGYCEAAEEAEQALCAASVEIKTCVDSESWAALSESIRLALLMCKLEGDV